MQSIAVVLLVTAALLWLVMPGLRGEGRARGGCSSCGGCQHPTPRLGTRLIALRAPRRPS
jgi:hypothetical protein